MVMPESLQKEKAEFDWRKAMHLPSKFAALNKLILRDLNGNTNSPTFSRYSKSDIINYLKNPYTYEKNLRDAVVYIYGASSHFRRLIQYFAGLTNLSYVVAPYRIDPAKANDSSIKKNYIKTLNLLDIMDIQNQFSKILTVCFREDTFYGTLWQTTDNVTLQQLPSDYCKISTIEGNVFNVSFDFSYFDTDSDMLEFYPPEFTSKYNIYLNDRQGSKWQDLDSPTSFAIKCNNDIPTYSIPPFAGILREIYDIEDYKQLKLTKAELENYAILVMKLALTKENEFAMELNDAQDFWRNLDNVLPEEVGSILSPMDVEKITFDRSGVQDTDYIGQAEDRLFSSAGVSSLLFNNPKASSNSLLLSIKADQALTFGIVRSIETAINRFLQSQSFGKNFKTIFLDVSRYNQKEMGDAYLKACQYGMPMVSFFCASQGLLQSQMDTMNYLEDALLGVKERFKPVSSSSTQSNSGDGEAGRPKSDTGDLTDAGESSQEHSGDEGSL